MAHLHMPFLAEIGLALHDVAANELLGILGCLRYSGGCIAYQDASATLDAKALQTGIDTQVTDQILQQTFHGESYYSSGHADDGNYSSAKGAKMLSTCMLGFRGIRVL